MREKMSLTNAYKVSIIVPVYNTAEYLGKCVESLLSQQYSNYEILLIDDGSTDESGSLCDRMADEHAQIKAFHKPNGGLISSWKYGVTKSTGEYVCFVDSDDWVEESMLAQMIVYATGNPREMISSDYIIERDHGTSETVYQKLSPGSYDKSMLEKEVFPYLLGQEHRYVTFSRCMKLISRSLIVQNMHYSDPKIRMGEDVTIMLPALLDCEHLVIMDHKAFYHYRYVTESMIHQYDRGMFENNQHLQNILKQVICDKCQDPDGMLYHVDQEYLFLLLLVLKNEARGNREGYRKKIRSIAKDPEIQRLVKNTKIEVHETANRLLYLVLKHPNYLTIGILRLSMIWYYRKAQPFAEEK